MAISQLAQSSSESANLGESALSQIWKPQIPRFIIFRIEKAIVGVSPLKQTCVGFKRGKQCHLPRHSKGPAWLLVETVPAILSAGWKIAQINRTNRCGHMFLFLPTGGPQSATTVVCFNVQAAANRFGMTISMSPAWCMLTTFDPEKLYI
jgi:hypothetical protein